MSEFVPFEISKKLKEKGFKEKVNAYYDNKERFFDVHPKLDMNDAGYRCSAPTISQVLKWLREEKKKFVKIEMHECKYLFAIERTDECSSGVGFQKNDALCFIPYKTYEEATIAGIEYVLDNLI